MDRKLWERILGKEIYAKIAPESCKGERVARKYGVDFALKKDPAQGKYLVFFKARDADALNAAFAEYTAKTLNRKKQKPSLKKQLSHFKQVAQELGAGREKNRQKGGMEL